MPPPLTTVIDRARQGDAQAIAHLLTRALNHHGIVARGHWQGLQLHLDLEAASAIPPSPMVSYIRRGLQRLGPACPLELVWVSGRRVGQSSADWRESFELGNGLSSPSAKASAAAADTLSEPLLGEGSALPQAPHPADHSPSPTASPLNAAELTEGSAVEPAPAYLSDVTLVALAHLAPLLSYLLVGTQWLGGWPLFWGGSFLLPWRVVFPLLLLLVNGVGANTTDMQRQTKAALNFQLTMLIAWTVTILLMFILLGFLFVVPLALFEIISCVVAAVRVLEGKPARYLAIRFVS